MKVEVGDIVKYENKERFWIAIVTQKLKHKNYLIFKISHSTHFDRKVCIFYNLEEVINNNIYYKFLNK